MASGVPIDFLLEYDPDLRLLRLVFLNEVTEESLLAADQAAAEFVGRKPIEAGIIDLSAISSFRATASSIQSLVTTRAVRLPGKPRVIIAPHPVAYSAARFFQALRELRGDRRIKVVRTIEEASKVLGLKSGTLRP
jgi:2-methylcitrate dehydratase PrpD